MEVTIVPESEHPLVGEDVEAQTIKLRVHEKGKEHPLVIEIPKRSFAAGETLTFSWHRFVGGGTPVYVGMVIDKEQPVKSAPPVQKAEVLTEEPGVLDSKAVARQSSLADDEALERYLGEPESSGEPSLPEGAEEKELAALMKEVTGKAVRPKRKQEQKESLITTRAILFRGATDSELVLLDNDREIPVITNGALARDVVDVHMSPDGESAEVVRIVERYPHKVVATVRLEQTNRGPALVAYPDSFILTRQPLVLPLTALDVGSSVRGLKVILAREPNIQEEEWKLSRVIGEAGNAVIEAEAIALRTPNGAKRVEQLNDEDIKAYAEYLDPHRFPILKGRLESLTAEKLHEQIRFLEDLARDLKSGKVSTDELVVRCLQEWELGSDPLVDSLDKYVHGSNRLDIRDIRTFTIDPKQAKDFDDALSYRELPDGRIEVGVHIADPTALIPSGSPLDLIAQFRQATQYLPKTLPLFPEVLANLLCSLVEGEDRLAFTTYLIYPPRATWENPEEPPEPEVHHVRTVMNSKRRSTYQQAQKDLKDKNAEWHEELVALQSFSKHFEKLMEKDGFVMLTTVGGDIEFELNAKGEPVQASQGKPLESMKLIEHMMIKANEEVTKTTLQAAPGAVAFLRVHRPPQKGNILALLKGIGYEDIWDGEGAYRPHEILEAIRARIDAEPREDVQIRKEATLVRTMEKAGYAVETQEGLGGKEIHFGLTLRHYGHYTSPIRRYADIKTHRLLSSVLYKRAVTVDNEATLNELKEVAGIANVRERQIMRSERDMNSFLSLSLLEKKLGANTADTRIAVRVVRVEERVALFEFDLPGGARFSQRMSRNDIRSSSGEKLSAENWALLRSPKNEGGKRIVFTVGSIDPTLRRVTGTVDIAALMNERGLKQLQTLSPTSPIAAHVDAYDQATGMVYVKMHYGKKQLLESYPLPLTSLRTKDGTPLDKSTREALTTRLREGGQKMIIHIGASASAATPEFIFERLVKTRAIPFVNPYQRVGEKYTEKIVQARIVSRGENALYITLLTRPSVKSYELRREEIPSMSDKAWNEVVAGKTLVLKLRNVDLNKNEFFFDFVRVAREKKQVQPPPVPQEQRSRKRRRRGRPRSDDSVN